MAQESPHFQRSVRVMVAQRIAVPAAAKPTSNTELQRQSCAFASSTHPVFDETCFRNGWQMEIKQESAAQEEIDYKYCRNVLAATFMIRGQRTEISGSCRPSWEKKMSVSRAMPIHIDVPIETHVLHIFHIFFFRLLGRQGGCAHSYLDHRLKNPRGGLR